MGDNNKQVKDLIGLSKTKLEAMKKKDIVDMLSSAKFEDLITLEVTEKISTDLSKTFDFFDKKISDMEVNIISNLVAENKKLAERCEDLELVTNKLTSRVERCEDLEFVVNKLSSRVAILEKSHWQSVQYNRRNNIEIAGIPNSINENQLENKVCEVLKSIDVNVEPADIEACHRLPLSRNEKKDNDEAPQRTIVKLVNRKVCEKALKNRKSLKDVDKEMLGFDSSTKLYVNDSLCPYYKGLFGKCRKLRNDRKIFACWTYNGVVTIKITENSRFINILHDNDIYKLFPNVHFDR